MGSVTLDQDPFHHYLHAYANKNILAYHAQRVFHRCPRGQYAKVVAQKVLDRLYATNGNYQFKKPKISISQANLRVAAYSPWKNTITLDQKAYDICRSYGRDSLSALAYILGHELVHAYQAEIKKGRVQTNFLAYTRNYSANVQVEKSADIQGLFTGQLAGYKVMRVMPNLIEQIYREYDLIGKSLPGYPKLAERKAGTQEVLAITKKLLDILESSNYLLVIGQHSLAASGYQNILQYYQGYEIYNNLGIAYTLAAREYWNPQTDKYLYPMEVDWYSNLSRTISRGQEQADASLEPMRMYFLDKAEAHFRTAARLRANYLPAHTNLVSVLNLKGKSVEALKYAELKLLKSISGRKKKKGQEAEMAEIALGITYALLPGFKNQAEAAAIFERLSGSDYVASALYAQQNHQRLHGASNPNVLTDVALPKAFREVIQLMDMGRTGELESSTLDEEYGISFARKHGPTRSVFVYSRDPGINLVTFQRFRNQTLPSASVLSSEQNFSTSAYRNILVARSGFYLHAAADKVILKVDSRGQVKEMVKYVIH